MEALEGTDLLFPEKYRFFVMSMGLFNFIIIIALGLDDNP